MADRAGLGFRTAKNELGIAPGAKLEAWLPEPSEATRAIIAANGPAIDRLARLSAIHLAPAPQGAAMQVGAGDAMLIVPLEGLIDIAAEKARLERRWRRRKRKPRLWPVGFPTRRSWNARSPRRSKRPARTTRTTPPKPNASAPRSSGSAWTGPVALVLATTTPGEAELFASLQGEGASSGALRSSCACRGATLPAAGATQPIPGAFRATTAPIAMTSRSNARPIRSRPTKTTLRARIWLSAFPAWS
jgi:hypothetical protein